MNLITFKLYGHPTYTVPLEAIEGMILREGISFDWMPRLNINLDSPERAHLLY